MSAANVGAKCTYTDQYGEHVAFVSDYEAGRADGDHHVNGFNNETAQSAGQGVTFSHWTVVGTGQGTITLHQ